MYSCQQNKLNNITIRKTDTIRKCQVKKQNFKEKGKVKCINFSFLWWNTILDSWNTSNAKLVTVKAKVRSNYKIYKNLLSTLCDFRQKYFIRI